MDLNCLLSAIKDLEIPSSYDEVSIVSGLEQADGESLDVLLCWLHHVLFEVHVIDGDLVCPESGRRFPIKEGSYHCLSAELHALTVPLRHSEHAASRRRGLECYGRRRRFVVKILHQATSALLTYLTN